VLTRTTNPGALLKPELRLRAHRTMTSNMSAGENTFAARGGWWVLAQLSVMLGAFLAPLLSSASSFGGTNAIQLAGAAASALGILLALAGLVTLGSALTPFPRPLAHTRLRQSGVYALVRHPIYSGVIFASFGWSLSWLSLPGLLVCVVVLLFFDRKSAFEERLLRIRFPEYSDYRLRVRKLLPWIY
jgi:protein-S-isoprenylcysteine O-methyltransferase Ste14